ncbi:MAG: hypothetical protein UV61_C0002G0261 [Candidatus Gottesmanbacteria bacterium GW2011_GWB1_43_11]|uniref:Uncharacterized protein n=1 Tax=Candidatus Gottesmanbacteria bacterium GW2011_GWB1_43_11 TaxID=1618446 RepID=A0A0G1CP55_9BACT|nr:MAG: hypothetical protein UV04_C0001G0149 [Candidatus Gottesmanbacteria bacterium GW2011_GWA2_42_16]KKS56338.1 MAG: hypothetical protein UV17_C0001G0148 [Candidatus Gottesmanbacteria bacterium GW2011_GWA1_42_26]KKS82346.1 MAG: hypothetical protein UV55_C0003G0065 [Candidatus Gottesmanbacteria bacterium GW2011_GWC1_43_10]KKS87540.1 MAG: hypothetical protein UV61_C0002G0261 [Candidatus Gottesmanbacteria bacterium GW2011_GWB1_43_11]
MLRERGKIALIMPTPDQASYCEYRTTQEAMRKLINKTHGRAGAVYAGAGIENKPVCLIAERDGESVTFCIYPNSSTSECPIAQKEVKGAAPSGGLINPSYL